MAKRTKEVSSKLDKLREKMQKVARSQGGGGFWYPDPGEHLIRILPSVGEMEFFFQEVATYNFPDGTKFYSAEFTTEGEIECPVRDLVKELYQGDPEEKELAKKLNSWPIYTQRYWMNVIVRDKQDDGGNTGEGPFIFSCPSTIFNSLMTLVNSPDYGDISDMEEGIDVTIVRSGEGRETDYNVFPRRYDTPLHQDPEQIKKWLEEAADLSWGELSDNPDEDEEFGKDVIVKIMPYNRVIKEVGLSPDVELGDIEAFLAKKETTKKQDKDVKGKLKQLKKEAESLGNDEPDEEAFPAEEEQTDEDVDEVGQAIQEAKQGRRRRRRR